VHDPIEPVPDPRRQGSGRVTRSSRRAQAKNRKGEWPAAPPAPNGPTRTTAARVGRSAGPVAQRTPTPQRDRPDAGITGQRGAASERCRGTRTSGEAPGRACVRAARLRSRRAPRGGSTGTREPAGPVIAAGPRNRSHCSECDQTRAGRRSARHTATDAAASQQGEEKGDGGSPTGAAPIKPSARAAKPIRPPRPVRADDRPRRRKAHGRQGRPGQQCPDRYRSRP
jgi:hypothetical protein